MLNKLGKLIVWFICFFLSSLIENLGWVEQGKAFLVMYIITRCLIFLYLVILDRYVLKIFISGKARRKFIGIQGGLVLLIELVATEITKNFLDVGFYKAYQLITFVICFIETIILICSTAKKKTTGKVR